MLRTAAAHAAGRVGPLPELAFFFKDPLGDGPSALGEQFAVLAASVASLKGEQVNPAGTSDPVRTDHPARRTRRSRGPHQ